MFGSILAVYGINKTILAIMMLKIIAFVEKAKLFYRLAQTST
jgi:hypothetical protein